MDPESPKKVSNKLLRRTVELEASVLPSQFMASWNNAFGAVYGTKQRCWKCSKTTKHGWAAGSLTADAAATLLGVAEPRVCPKCAPKVHPLLLNRGLLVVVPGAADLELNILN